MDTTTDHHAALVNTLEHLGLSEMLTGYVPRAHVTRRVSWQEFTRFIEGQGYEIVKEGGNIYGRVGVRPAASSTAPKMRVVTRSDVAAVYGSRPRAA
jgi:hypothetical protein